MLGNSRRVRLAAAALAVTAAIAGCFGQAAADEADEVTADAPASLVSVTSDVGPSSEPCVSGLLARLGATCDVIDTTERFSVAIHVARPLCTPISAKAAVYAMPGGADAWPQTLVEAVPFEVGEVGTVTVSFDKPCTDLQFDIIEGDTPQEISPFGKWHGPLLFAADTATALQWFGTAADGCGEVPPPPPPPTETTVPTVTPRTVDEETTTSTTTSTTVLATSVVDPADPVASNASSVTASATSASAGSASAAKLAFTG